MLNSNYLFKIYMNNNLMSFTGILTAIFLQGFAICDYLATKVYLNSKYLSWVSVVFVCTSTLSANWGVQAIPNLMASELYSSEDRAIMKSFSRGVQSLLIFCSLMVSTRVRKKVSKSRSNHSKTNYFFLNSNFDLLHCCKGLHCQ